MNRYKFLEFRNEVSMTRTFQRSFVRSQSLSQSFWILTKNFKSNEFFSPKVLHYCYFLHFSPPVFESWNFYEFQESNEVFVFVFQGKRKEKKNICTIELRENIFTFGELFVRRTNALNLQKGCTRAKGISYYSLVPRGHVFRRSRKRNLMKWVKRGNIKLKVGLINVVLKRVPSPELLRKRCSLLFVSKWTYHRCETLRLKNIPDFLKIWWYFQIYLIQ